MKSKLYIFLLTFSIIASLLLPLSALMPSVEESLIFDKVIRLHVLANSDSDYDQELKLKIRDAVLKCVSELISNTNNINEVQEIINNNIDYIESVAQKALYENNSEYSATVSLTEEDYPTRVYGDYTLPAGNYTSLRVKIGSAEGANWWCILFPKLCTGFDGKYSVAIADDELLEAGLTPSQIKLIKGDSANIVIKFRIFEFIKELFS